jgi:hypothetical protein
LFKLFLLNALAKEPDKAAEMLAPVTKERPGDLDVRLLQVAITNLKGDTAASMKALQVIVDEKPAKSDPYLALAALYAEKRTRTPLRPRSKRGWRPSCATRLCWRRWGGFTINKKTGKKPNKLSAN